MLLVDHPRNESAAHFTLKQIAKYLARHKGCIIIGEEVSGFADKTIHKSKKGIIDVAGIKIVDTKVKELPEIITYGYESKASLQDYKRGFNAGCSFTSIIAPIGIINKELIPKGIGLIEVDLENYKIGTDRVHYGITVTKRASRRHKRKRYKTMFNHMKETARRATNNDLFKNAKIELARKGE